MKCVRKVSVIMERAPIWVTRSVQIAEAYAGMQQGCQSLNTCPTQTMSGGVVDHAKEVDKKEYKAVH